MAHFAEIDENNVVIQVIVIPDEQEYRGADYISQDLMFGGRWIQTSYNTFRGAHLLGGTPLRKNYAGIGYSYNEELDAFVPPKRYNSWLLDEETATWKAPVPKPEEGRWKWDESTVNWIETSIPTEEDPNAIDA